MSYEVTKSRDRKLSTDHSLLQVTIDRKSHTLDHTFIAVGSFFMLLNNINMGAQLDLEIIKSVLKRPLGPICGFISQFAIMPVVSMHQCYDHYGNYSGLVMIYQLASFICYKP